MIKCIIIVIISLISSSEYNKLIAANQQNFINSINTAFIENKGQIFDLRNKLNPAVLYLLNTPGFNIQLRASGWSYDVYQVTSSDTLLLAFRHSRLASKTIPDNVISEKRKAESYLFHRIDITLIGANSNCQLIPSDPLPDYFNYFKGSCPPEGIKNVKQYSKVTYKNIYPDIDLEFYTNPEHGFKYNFVIHAGGNVKAIRLRIDGPENIKLESGTLNFRTRFGNVEEVIPESYYLVNDARVNIKARFKMIISGFFGFSVDKPVPGNSLLIIDPTSIRLWGTYYGGIGWDGQARCSIDNSGNVFLSGTTNSIYNIASTGSYQDTLAGDVDGFLAKFNATGQREWGTYFGGTNYDEVWGCAIDKTGNIYLSGATESTTGIASPGAHQSVYGGVEDCFIGKFNEAGNRVWGTYYGGAGVDNVGTVSTDGNGNVFLSGHTDSDTGIATAGSYQPILNNTSADAFLAKFDSNGVRQWGTYYGGELGDFNQFCCTDLLGNVYFGGITTSLTNIASPGAFQTTFGGGTGDAFLVKFTTGGQRIWGTYYGGSNAELGWASTVDSAGNVCLVGRTNSLNGIASAGCFQPAYGGGFSDAFVVKFNSSGQRLWGTYYGGSDYDEVFCCTAGGSNAIFFGGISASSNNISTPRSYQPVLRGAGDGILVKFDSSGQRQWGTYYGGSNNDEALMSIVYMPDDTVYFSGYTNSPDYIASPGSWQQVYGGDRDDLLIKFLECWPIDTAGPIAGPVNVCKPFIGVNYSIPLLAHSINYVWTIPTGFTITNGAGSASITVDVSNGATSGLIMVKGFNKCGDPGDSASLFVTVGLSPVPVISGPNNTCAGTGKVYTTDPGKANYQWSVSAGGVITAGGTPTDNTVTVTWNVAGIDHVYLNYTDTNGCSAAMPTDYVVQVTPSPAVSIMITPTLNSVCQGTLVTFNSTSINEGGNPVYQWQVNGINSGIDSSSFSYIPLNNDIVRCILTSSVAGCIMDNPDTSNAVIMFVNPNLPVGITITALPIPPVCSGSLVTFTAHPVNEGNTPTYQWKVNGINAGTNSQFFTYIPLNGDLVSCVLTSSETCTTNNPVTSTQYPVTVNPILPVSVSVTPTSNPFCAGSTVTFTATPTFGGTTPSFQWKVNGINAGTNSNIFTYNPVNNDQVYCILTSSELCTSNNPASSIIITMAENNNLPAGVSISASSNPFCPGTSVTFTAIPNNGGPLPVYQWKVNGINVGTNSITYSYNPVNGDSVRCIMTSNLPCVTGNPASSNKIIMSGTLAPIVTFTSCFDTITTINAKPIKLKGGIPLGGTYSGPGVNSLTGIYTPSLAGIGTHTITYSYTNAALCTAAKSISILNLPSSILTCGNPLTDVRDNRVYQTVQIGIQCWLATNLNFGTTIASTQDQRDNCISEKYCYNDNPANCTNRGGLYQWDEVMRFDETPAVQGFCPPAWHIPTENDWNTLFAVFINNGFAGSPLKYSGYSGFNALLSGARHINRGWDFQGFATFFWSSTAKSDNKAWAHGLNDPDPSVSNYPASRVNAFSVRCLKD